LACSGGGGSIDSFVDKWGYLGKNAVINLFYGDVATGFEVFMRILKRVIKK